MHQEITDETCDNKPARIRRYYFPTVTIVGICILISAFSYLTARSDSIVRENAIENASQYLNAIAIFRSLYTSEVVKPSLANGIKVGHDYKQHSNMIPLPATFSMMLGEQIVQSQSGAKTSLYSPYPFPWRKEESQQIRSEAFANNAWQYLNANPEDSYYQFLELDNRLIIHYAVADRMKEACIGCHNNHPQSPKTDWEIGDVRGVLQVSLPLGKIVGNVTQQVNETFIILLGFSAFLLLCGYFAKKIMSKDDEKIAQAYLSIEDKNKMLSKALLEAKQAEQLKGEFLASMSHEIRTPLNGILGMLTLVKLDKLDSKNQKFISIARSSANTLLRIVNDILDFSKLSAGRFDIVEGVFNLKVLLTNIKESFYAAVAEKQIDLKLIFEQLDEEWFIGDEGRIEQVLTNLIGNAVKFTDRGIVLILVKVNQDTSSNLYQLQINIIDSGIGIAEKNINKLFESFTQEDASTSKRFGGTGLGLSISQKLAKLMNGNITVKSKSDFGSAFILTLPLKIGQPNIVAEGASAPQSNDLQSADHLTLLNNEVEKEANRNFMPKELLVFSRTIKVLLAEDSPINRELMLAIFEDLNIDVRLAENGRIAVDLFQNEALPFDLILMDCQMPEMDGYQATQLIRNIDSEYAKSIPIIALTAHAIEGEKEKCIAAGMSDFFTKPIDSNQLLNLMKHWTNDISLADIAPELTSNHRQKDSNLVNELKTWDKPSILSLLDGDEQKVDALTALALKEIEGFLSLIKTQKSDENYFQLKRTAHTIRGISANICAEKLSYIASQLEASNSDEPQQPELIASLNNEFTSLSKEIYREIK
ncbi:MAG: hypothetical protein COB51_03750 [Moraxellaceae bacterium]|nr:MAG: hypothetical protein COB51_03750 [Moraxellaceae bacterium]